MEKKIKEIWPDYEIVCKLGSGAFGNVYKIKKSDGRKDYYSALKVIMLPKDSQEVNYYRELGLDDKGLTKQYERLADAFYREVELMEELKGNTNIVSYENHKIIKRKEGFGYEIYIQMQLLTPLNQVIKQKKLKEEEVIQLGIDICKALELCEKKHILHRDIKLENIFIGKNGEYKLGDFGIARVAETATLGTVTGTMAYIAPEIFHNKKYDSRVDIYSLGIVLYQLLNDNRLPFLSLDKNFVDVQNALLKRMKGEKFPDIPNVSDNLNKIILKACEYEPDNRYVKASEFRKAMENYLSEKEKTISVFEKKESSVYHLFETDTLIQSDINDKINEIEDEEKTVTISKKKEKGVQSEVITENQKSSVGVKVFIVLAVAIIAVIVVFLISISKEKDDDSNYNDVAATTTDESKEDMSDDSMQELVEIGNIEITAGVDYILPGDKVEFYCQVDDAIYEASENLMWRTSDSTIATITNNGVFEAIAPGHVTLTADFGGNIATREVQVLEVNENKAETTIKANTTEVNLSIDEPSQVIEIMTSSEIPADAQAYAYCSGGPLIKWEWLEWSSEGIITLKVTCMGQSEGVLTVYITPTDEPDNVVGLARVHINYE